MGLYYFNDKERAALERVLERESRIGGRIVSAYELLKGWVLERLYRDG